ncbi:uncharacterized protein LOC135084879 isoform X2 [Ostrinia nubilalis]|uniref:uncharacterized protein LOC135084879 isoform X2 n=1 Tax=Ostrinia nubilalis TaxID=29057 RepID=UPI0030822631
MTRCLRDTLRQICEDQPVNRYSQHRRDHHRPMGCSGSNDTGQGSSPMVSTGVPAMSSCEAIQGTYQQTCPPRPKICCYCQKPMPCSCAPRSSVQFQRFPKVISQDSTDSNIFPRTRSISVDDKSCICSGLSMDDFEKNVKEAVSQWLQELPVYANDKPEDRRVREDMARKLVEKLKRFKDDENFEDKAKAEIAECVNNMPMWCPGNEEDQGVFKQRIVDNLLNKIRSITKVDKFESEISKWVETLNLKSRDSQGKIVDKQNIVENIVNKLKPLALNQPTDASNYKEALKTEIMDILEELPIQVEGDRKMYLNKLADRLAGQLHTIPAKDIKSSSFESLEDEFQKQIWEWLKEIPEYSSASASKVPENQKSVKALANKLQKLQAQGIENSSVQEQMQNEINEWLENNVSKKSSLDLKTKNKLAEKLLGNLIHVSKSAAKKTKTSLSQDSLKKQIADWLDDIPELAGGDRKENEKDIETLAKKLFELRSQGKDDTELEDEILNWLTNAFEKKGKRLDIRNQSSLVNSLLGRINNLSGGNEDENLIEAIRDCLGDISKLDISSPETKKMVEKLANKIQELQSNKGDINKEDIKDEIDNWLNEFSKQTGANISPKTRNQLMQKLMNIATSVPKQRKRWNKQDNLQQAISEGIANILGGSSLSLANGEKKELQSKISNLLSRNIDKVKAGDGSGEIKTKIATILEQDANLSSGKAKKIADDIVTKVQGMKLPESSINLHSDELKNMLKEEVGLILDASNVHCDNRDAMESTLTDVLVDQIMRGEDDRQTKDRLIRALRDSDISKEQTEEIASKLINVAKEMSLSQRTQDSTMRLSMSKSKGFEPLSPVQKEMFQGSAEQEIVEFIQEITGDSSPLSVKKYKAAAEKLAQRLSDIMSEADTSIADKRNGIESEVSKCLQSLSISTEESQSRKLADKLQNLAFKTSTPKRSSLDGFSFRPRRDSRGSTMSAIENASHFKMQASSPSKEEEQYMNQLVDIINSWMRDLPIDLDTEDGKGFKEVMIRDLAGDIIDRQKYLQLNPDAKTSPAEELEHLKYQVFRWLHKLPDLKNLMPSIAKTDDLMERIKSVPVPQLIKSPDRRSGRQRGSIIQDLSQNFELLHDEISKWIGAVPSKFYATSDKDHHQQMVKDLAEQIDQLHKDEALTENLLDDVVSDWLQKMLKEYNEQYFSSLTEGLKGALLHKGLISLLESSMLMRQSSHVMQENLRGFILDWLKEKPLYQKRPSIEKREQEQLVAELSKNLKDTLKASHPSEAHRDDRILDDIKSHIKRFPMESHLKLDEDFHHSTANDLMEYLKMLQMFQNMSEIQSLSQSQSGIEFKDILPVLDEWIGKLPLQARKASVDDRKLDSLKQEFAKTIHQLKQQHPTHTETGSAVLKDEIKKYLHKFPIEPAKKKDQQFVSEKIDELHNMLHNLQSQMATPGRASISVDGVRDVIINWAKKLPFQSGATIEKSKSEVDKIATKTKKMLSNVKGADDFEKIKPNLEKEIKAFVNKLPIQKKKFKENYIHELTNQLNDFVKASTMTQPSMTTDSSFSSKSGLKKAADVLYDNIEDWCNNLPIPSANTPEEKEKVKTLKQNIASKLINIIGDLNVNPEIFNDDSLYDDLLNDEIDKLLSTLPPSSELERNLPALKENLIQKVNEAKLKMQDELAGQVYKQQLRDAISKTLPSIEDLSLEEQAPFEVLKDNLADAYIELHYAAYNEEMKRKLKAKISDEINQFCDDYLQQYPASPIDPSKLNRELYNTLQKVPVPKDETIKTQVEQVRIKDEINEWLQELPLKEQTPAELLQQNKIVNVLAKRLHDIEKEKECDPGIDVEDRMKKEIHKWIKKLPIIPGEEGNVESMVDQLTAKLKSSEESRRFSISRIRHSIDTASDEQSCAAVCPFYSKYDKPANLLSPSTDNRYLSQYAPPFPPSTLSTEDKAHLERIRERNQQRQQPPKPAFPPCHCKDASVNPIPIEAGSQTDVGPAVVSSSAKSIQSQPEPCSRSQAPSTQSDLAPCSQAPVSPQVVVKEFYWDSPESAMREPGFPSPCGQGQSVSFQGQGQPCGPQPQQFPWPQSQANLPKFGPPQPSPCSRPQGQFLTPDQSRMPQAPCMSSPPMTMQSPRMPQPPMPQSCMMSPPPQMPPQSPCMMPPAPQMSASPYSQNRTGQSPCMSQPPSMPSRMTSQPYPSAPPCGGSQPAYPSAPPWTSQQPQSPCMSKPSSQQPMRSPCMNQPQMPETQSPYSQYNKSPCMSTPQESQPEMPPCHSRDTPPPRQRTQPSRQIPPCQSQENRRETRKPFRQPCFGSPEISSTSSPFDTECPDADRRFGPKVTRLGSLDDVPCMKNCGSQSPRAKRSRGSPDEDFDWTIRFPEDDGFWGTPCPRRRVHKAPMRNADGPFVKEKERKEEKVRCRCRKRILTKCMGRRPQTCNFSCQDDESMQHCSKCCGAHCPHPSYLFFR